MDIKEDYKKLLDEINNEAQDGELPNNIFFEKCLINLEEIGVLQEPQKLYFNKKKMKIEAYDFDPADNSISLIITDFINDYNPILISNKDVLGYYENMKQIIDVSYENNMSKYCDESEDIIPFSKMLNYKITNEENKVSKIKFIILTNKYLSQQFKKINIENIYNIPTEINLYHLDRILNLFYDIEDEPVIIDFTEQGYNPIPCLHAKLGKTNDYDSYLGVINGNTLANIYKKYGSKVLEGNVRAFLGITGKNVNYGIKQTIINEPKKFFIYNNGIAITASNIELDSNNQYITKIENLQIINGGQTTVSLAQALMDKKDLLDIFVTAKITVIKDTESVDENGIKNSENLIVNISKYSNKQNSINAADLMSNDPFQIKMEKMSKNITAPPKNGDTIETYWYYERARKKYEQEIFKKSDPERKKFIKFHPKNQKITKELLAKYILCVKCKPDIVCKGGMKAVKVFAEGIEKEFKTHPENINDYYFKTCIASAILFKETDKIVNTADWYQTGGPKAQIVAYTISKLISLIPKDKSINWLKIWNEQDLYIQIKDEINNIAQLIYDYTKKEENLKGVLITEYFKKENSWNSILNLNYNLNDSFLQTLISREEEEKRIKQGRESGSIQKGIDSITEIYKKGSFYWNQVLNKGLEKIILMKKSKTY